MSIGVICESLLTLNNESILSHTIEIILLSHGISKDSLVKDILSKKNKIEYECAITKFSKEQKARLELFIESLCALAIDNNNFEALEHLVEILLHYTQNTKRALRFLSTHSSLVVLKELSILQVRKKSYMEQMHCTNVKADEVEAQLEFIKNKLELLLNEVLIRRSKDVMPDIRSLVIECIEKLVVMNTIEEGKVSIGQFLFDEAKKIRKQALRILRIKQDKEYIMKIIQMAYKDNEEIVIQALKTLKAMQQLLSAEEANLVLKLILSKSTEVAKEAARFLVGEISRLEISYKKEGTELMEALIQLVSYVVSGLNKEVIKRVIVVLGEVTDILYDIKSISVLLMRGEKDQSTETKLPENHLDLLCEVLYVVVKKLTAPHKNTEDECKIDEMVLECLPGILSVHRHEKRVIYLLKTFCLIKASSVNHNEKSVGQVLKILKIACAIFKSSKYEEVITAVCEVFNNFSQLNYINEKFCVKPIRQYKKYLHFIKESLAENKLNSELIKLPIIITYLDKEMILDVIENIKPLLIKVAKLGNGENLVLVCKSLFSLGARVFSLMWDSELESNCIEDVIDVYSLLIKSEGILLEVKLQVFDLFVQLLIIVSNDYVRTKKERLYYTPTEELTNEITKFLKEVFNHNTRNWNNSNVTLSQHIGTLIIASKEIFHSELSKLYLSTFNDQKDYFNRIKKKYVDYYNYFKDFIIYCHEHQPTYSLYKLKTLILPDKEDVEAYYNFILNLLKEVLRDVNRVPLLEIVQVFIVKELYSKENIRSLYKLFDSFSQHIMKLKSKEGKMGRKYVEVFRKQLLAKVGGRVVRKNQPNNRNSIQAKLPTQEVEGNKPSCENEEQEEGGDESYITKKRDRSIEDNRLSQRTLNH